MVVHNNLFFKTVEEFFFKKLEELVCWKLCKIDIIIAFYSKIKNCNNNNNIWKKYFNKLNEYIFKLIKNNW